jgi:hypothetical protein
MGSEGFSECAFNGLLSKNSQMMVGEEDESFTQNLIEDNEYQERSVDF